jgi:hypothetical protein
MLLIMFNLDKLPKMKQAGRQAGRTCGAHLTSCQTDNTNCCWTWGFSVHLFLQTKKFIALSISMSHSNWLFTVSKTS